MNNEKYSGDGGEKGTYEVELGAPDFKSPNILHVINNTNSILTCQPQHLFMKSQIPDRSVYFLKNVW
jgi:hypothetical protein